MVKGGVPEEVFLLERLVLKFLSCRLDTLLPCGFICLDWKWPLIHKFSEISVERREEILRKWSRQRYLTPLIKSGFCGDQTHVHVRAHIMHARAIRTYTPFFFNFLTRTLLFFSIFNLFLCRRLMTIRETKHGKQLDIK